MELEAKNLDQLLSKTIRKIWGGEYDHLTESEAITYDNCLRSESTRYSLDLGLSLALTPTRYTKLLRAYLDPTATHRFLSRAKEIGTGTSKRGAVTSLSTLVNQSNQNHRFGSCILGFTYRGIPSSSQPSHAGPTLTMFSRTAYITYMGALDLLVAHHLAEEISHRIELPASQPMRFVWFSSSLQFHTLKSLPYLLSTDLLTTPHQNKLQERTLAWHKKFVTPPGHPSSINGESRFGPVKRVQAVYRTAQHQNQRNSYPADTLSLDALVR